MNWEKNFFLRFVGRYNEINAYDSWLTISPTDATKVAVEKTIVQLGFDSDNLKIGINSCYLFSKKRPQTFAVLLNLLKKSPRFLLTHNSFDLINNNIWLVSINSAHDITSSEVNILLLNLFQ